MIKTKKLLFVIASLQNSGGSERALTGRVNYLVQNFNYDIKIVTTNQNAVETYYDLDSRIEIVNIPISFGISGLGEKLKYIFFNSYKEEKILHEFIVDNKFDVCTSFGSETFLYKGKNSHPFYKIKENRFTYKKLLGDDDPSIMKKIWRYFRFRKAIYVQKKIDCSVTLTQEDADFWGRYLQNIVVMPNFINTTTVQTSTLQEKIVIAVGRLEVEKDFESLIESYSYIAQKQPDWKLHIFGSGTLKPQLQNLINDRELQDKVILKGSVKNIFEKYKESSIFVMTSHYEGFPNTMLEAMAHRIPVVAFESVGGVKVLVKYNKNGFLIQNRNVEELADKIVLLMNDKTLRDKMGDKSYQVAQEYSIESIMMKWHQFYQNAISLK